MIISAYPGTGKTYMALMNPKVVDLDSSCFLVEGVHSEDWLDVYVNLADYLSSQDRIVLTSAHPELIAKIQERELAAQAREMRELFGQNAKTEETIKKLNPDLVVVLPSLKLEDVWLARLKARLEQEENYASNYRAWKRAQESFASDIRNLAKVAKHVLWIENENQYLADIFLEKEKEC